MTQRVFEITPAPTDLDAVTDAEGIVWVPKNERRRIWKSTTHDDLGDSVVSVTWGELLYNYGPLKEVAK